MFIRFFAKWTVIYTFILAVLLGLLAVLVRKNVLDTETLFAFAVPLVLMIGALSLLALLKMAVRAAEVRPGTARVWQFLPYPFVAAAYLPWLFFWWIALGVWGVLLHAAFAVALHLVEFRPKGLVRTEMSHA